MASAYRLPIHVSHKAIRFLPRLIHLSAVIEAEVRYAVRNEYAQTAVDFIARRCRLSFLNAEAAFEALPRVVAIMADELGWSAARKTQELRRGVMFLGSMGLRGVPANTPGPLGWSEWLETKLMGRTPMRVTKGYSRAQFEAGELNGLKAAFLARATDLRDGEMQVSGGERLSKSQLQEVLSDLSGYEETKAQHLQNVLEEAGFDGRDDIALDEFLEVSSSVLTHP